MPARVVNAGPGGDVVLAEMVVKAAAELEPGRGELGEG